MLKNATLLLLLLTTSNILAQGVTYQYDNAGNRIKRLASGPQQPGCDFNLSLSGTINATPGQSITLNPGCTGGNCGEVTYSWTGNNTSGNGLTFTAPATADNYTYTLKANKSGCSEKTATVTLSVQTTGGGVLANGCYTIMAKQGSKYLQPENGNNGARIRQYGANGQPSQIFQLEAVSGTAYRITSQSSGKFWEAAGLGGGSPVNQQSNWTGSDVQKWNLVAWGDGSYKLKPENTTAIADMEGGTGAEGAGMFLYGSHGGDNQRFIFTSAACSSPPACPSPRNPENPSSTTPGLAYKYYEATVDWCATSILATLSPKKTGTVANFLLNPRDRDTNMGFEFSGYLDVPTDGTYTFYLNSDDASAFYIGNQAIVTYEGCHGFDTEQSATICLKAGKHAIKTLITQGGQGFGITVSWAGPGISKQTIPDNKLSSAGTTSCAGTGYATLKRWNGISGSSINDLMNGTGNLANTPSSTSNLTSLQTPADASDNYGQQIQGYITAPQTGTYYFWIASDDNSQLYLSTSSDPNNKQLIANVNSWTPSQSWNSESNQKSAAINLVGCTQYYFEVRHKEGGGGDNLAVGWAKPGQGTGSPSQIIPGGVLSPYTGSSCTQPAAPTLSASPTSINSGSSSTLSASGCSGGTINWVNGGPSVSPATTTTYTATCTQNGCTSSVGSVTVTVTTGNGNGSGTGLTGNYFNSMTPGGTVELSRTDATVNFEWGDGSPGAGVGWDGFSVRWTGQVEAPVSGLYTFYTTTDDGAKLWVDNLDVPMVNQWVNQGPTTHSGTISLVAGQKYNIKMEYFDSGGGATAKLLWSYPNQGQQIIPQSRLYPTSGGGGTQGCILNKVRLLYRADCCWDRLPGAKIWGSNDGSNWTELLTINVHGTPNNWQEFGITNNTAYSWVRYTAGAGFYGELRELEFYNDNTKLTGTPFYDSTNPWDASLVSSNVFDGNTNTMWHGSQTGPVNYVGLNLTGCSSQCTPPSAPALSASSPSINSGGSSTLSASNCQGTVTWSLGLGNNNSVQVNPSVTTTYTATCTQNGCTSSASSVTVTVNNPPAGNCYELRVAGNQKRITNVNGVVKVKDQNNSSTQIWKLVNDGSYVKIVAVDGTGRVLGVNNGGSSSGDEIRLQTDNGQDHQRWTQQLVSDDNPANKYGFVRKNAAQIIGSAYNWGGGDASDAVNDLKLTTSADLNVYGWNKFFLDSKTCPAMRIGVQEDYAENQTEGLVLSPNPSNGAFHANFYLADAQKATLLVFDIKGRMLHERNIKGQGAHRERIEISNAVAGTYIVVLRRQNGTETKRVVVIK